MTFDQWVETVDGQKCVDDSILKRPEIDQAFLRNRLWWAFTAGMEKGRTDARAAQETGRDETPLACGCAMKHMTSGPFAGQSVLVVRCGEHSS
jgi:hypothetical protein